MDLKERKLSINMTGDDVALLHVELARMGLPVSPKEVSDRRAGDVTLKQVRILQKRLKLNIDESVLLDVPSILAINKHMTELGLTKKDNSTGWPSWRSFAIRAKTQLKAILDLRRK